jgi:hypothetical protein
MSGEKHDECAVSLQDSEPRTREKHAKILERFCRYTICYINSIVCYWNAISLRTAGYHVRSDMNRMRHLTL